jgi:1-acyl-sn-glycerol-3-phosphate acyltransferase
MAMYALARWAESNNQLHYESRSARIIAGFLKLMVNILHTKESLLDITNVNGALITAGPHRTGWEAVVLASKIKGAPPQFFATDYFNFVPGVSSFMNMFKIITTQSKAKKNENGQSANALALDTASNALREKGCVALFPQGTFSRLEQEPPRVYDGAAKLAVSNKIAIQVVRLDGYWCLQNPLIPLFVRNNAYYRAFFSGLHRNNIRATLCCVIDFHLKPENEHLTDKQKVEEISAQLYAYYRHTKDLTIEDIETIKTEISNQSHLGIWRNKVDQYTNKKALEKLIAEAHQLEEPTALLMTHRS